MTVVATRETLATIGRPTRARSVLAHVLVAGAVVFWAPASSAQRFGLQADCAVATHILETPLIPGAQAEPQEPKRPDQRVTGKVLDADGKAVERAEVRFEGPNNKVAAVWTNSEGAFSFTGPAGNYVVTVKAGERRKVFNVKIEDNRLIPSTLVIDPEWPVRASHRSGVYPCTASRPCSCSCS
jgi:hypothetical protein